ncbi:MCE family protein [Amycolatopsis sp. K13G38]|uniref:MCE family protein n=1 Tax=Amycolatopsis acididurans TaxID=2724524 RepID=A0ABX1J393_9PSEU|nr:MlaD family protein [Amycolatopsis acididurans]NKQ54242.1 MCE family protein [Amycolatopsis acididurans]
MTRARRWLTASLVTISVGAAGCTALASDSTSDYSVRLVMSNAAELAAGSPVLINGRQAGAISALGTKDGKAVVDVQLSGSDAPVHSGTTAVVRWKAVLGERYVELVPGPVHNATIPSGGMVPVSQDQVDVDEVLSALDPPTRAHLTSMIQQLNATLKDNPGNVQATLRTAGPAVDALGQVLKAVGEDSHAINNLVTDLRVMMEPLASRQGQLQQVVGNVTNLATQVAPQQQRLSDALAALPPTLGQAKSTLDKVPGTVDKAAPLLTDLRPAASQLAAVSKNLSPFLADLRPTVAELKPTLAAASELLKNTPQLLDSAHAVVPDINSVVDRLNPAVDFLRPYTPDLAGWLANWGSAFAYYDSQGHYAGAVIRAGVSSFDENPGLPLTLNVNPAPAPGTASGQPWTDAQGSGMR